jgi:hypothetical protein
MNHFPIRPMTGRLIAAVGAVAAACAISSTACAATYAPATHAGTSTTHTTRATHPTSAAIPCAGANDLRLRIASGQGSGAGVTYYTLVFTNTSGSSCSLSGYPYVSMVSRTGSQLGSPAGHGLTLVVPLVILAPGATAHTTLAYYGGRVSAGRGCGPVTKAYELRVYVAGQKLALYAPLGVHACSRAGQVYLTITQSFRAGNG